MKLSIISIHYQSPEMIHNLLESCARQVGDFEMEFIVIDNSCNYVHTTHVPIQLIEPGYNSGFARGVNAGLRAATGDFCIVINQDAYLEETNTLERLVQQAQQLPAKTVLSCRILDDDGNYQQSIWLDNPDLQREWRFGAIHYKLCPDWKEKFDQETKATHEKSGYVPRVNGAFFVLKNDKHLQEAYFDNDFFLYGEDVEWALRLQKQKWQFYYLADVRIRHIGSASSTNSSIKQQQILVSDWLVMRKIHGRFYLRCLLALIRFNLGLNQFLRTFYKWRKGHLPIEYNEEQQMKEENLQIALKKYKSILLNDSQLSTDKHFKLNCYAAN